MAGIYRRKGSPVYYGRVQKHGVEHRRSLETTDRRVAERRFRQWREGIESAAWGERPRVAFREAVRQFVTQHCITLKPASAARYVVSLRQLADVWGSKFLDEVTRASLAEFETGRRSAGASPSTVRRDLSCLSSLMTFCEDREWIDEGANIVPGYMRRRSRRGLKEGKPRTRYLSTADETALLKMAAAAKYSKGPLAGAIMVAIDTGLRAQEQFSLQWPQVDLANNLITTTEDTKNGRARVVPLQARSAQFLAQLKLENRARAVPSVYVFSKANGKRYRNLYRGFKALAAAAGITDLCWHDLRRTAGCRWLQVHRKTMDEVSSLLGHGSILVTSKSYAFMDQASVARQTAAQNPAQVQPVSSEKRH